MNTVRFSDDGAQIISSSRDAVCVWDAASGRLVRRLAGTSMLVLARHADDENNTPLVATIHGDTLRIYGAAEAKPSTLNPQP